MQFGGGEVGVANAAQVDDLCPVDGVHAALDAGVHVPEYVPIGAAGDGALGTGVEIKTAGAFQDGLATGDDLPGANKVITGEFAVEFDEDEAVAVGQVVGTNRAAKAANEGLGGHGVASEMGSRWPAAEGRGMVGRSPVPGVFGVQMDTLTRNKRGCVGFSGGQKCAGNG